MKRVKHISSFVAAGGLILLLIAPLCGLPVAVPGIPVWYQDTFFIALICGGGVSLISLLLYFAGFFRKVHWNLMDGLVLLILIFSLVRLSFQEMIPQSTWIQLTFLAGNYGTSRILWSSINKKSL
ncbi:hypothetical protein KUV50_17805 [Membranicola marinus]|uniref:Uncharacterized protein n=1 Tax=Membranihabitans marinus TaxID=1227546 RepID=A0A953LCZ1_9BACT|nr:hypothetical protein [Membranihabitans marinus]MBY5960011.1 hypothetical protein [Membranihabitans marinus]